MPADNPETPQSKPLIRLGDAGVAPILSYNVPQPSEYTGRNYIELEFDDDIWSDAAYEQPDPEPVPTIVDIRSETPVYVAEMMPEPAQAFVNYYAAMAQPVTVQTDGGVSTDPAAEGVRLAPDGGTRAIGGDGSPHRPRIMLEEGERQRLGEYVFEKGGLETLAKTNPESLPAVFEALGVNRDPEPAEMEALSEALAARTTATDQPLTTNRSSSPSRESVMAHSVTDPDRMQPQATGVASMNPERTVVTPQSTPESADVEASTQGQFFEVQDAAFSELISRYGAASLAHNLQEGWRIREELSFAGDLVYDLIPPKEQESTAEPRVSLVETYKLSNFLGDYGAGRTVQTFSLLPGEKHEISVKTYRQSETTREAATSILDGYSKETADSFGEELHSENSRRDTSEENFSYHAEAKASASWGWGSASVSGGVAGSTASSRESFAKNVSNTTKKHAAKTSAKRNVEVNTSSTSTETSGTEKSIKREIENINLSRTLNFVFRQMNQEFISLLHLVDVRLAFHNGDSRSYREFTLAELDPMLDELVDPDEHDTVRDAVWEALYFVFDYQGEHVPAIEEHALAMENGDPLENQDGIDLLDPDTKKPPSFWRFIPRASTYMRPASDTPGLESEARPGPTVEGIILNASTVSLATDGVIVEALLGQGEALDRYSQRLQEETAESRELSNELLRAESDRLRLAHSIVESADGSAAENALVYETVFGRPPAADDESEDETPEPEPVTQ